MSVEVSGIAGFAPSVNIILKPDLTDPEVIQEIASSGVAKKYFAHGDEVIIPWTDYSDDNAPVLYQYPFIVVDIADAQDERNAIHRDALWLMAKYTAPITMTFDQSEINIKKSGVYEEGKYYYYKSGNGNYYDIEVTIGDSISNDRYYNYKPNMGYAIKNGYNRWSMSAARQWLNSNARRNWWKSQHVGDMTIKSSPENFFGKPGWLYGFTKEWREIFKPVRVQTVTDPTIDNSETDITYDTFFLPSCEQMYGVSIINGVEGKYWPYWKTITGLSEPTNGSQTNPVPARSSVCIGSATGSTAVRSVTSQGDIYCIGDANGNFIAGLPTNSYLYQPCCVLY